MNTKNSKTNEPHKFLLNLSQRLDLVCSSKLIYLLHVENIRKQYKSNNSLLKIT